MFKKLKKIGLLLLAVIISGALIFSIPVINLFVKGKFGKEETFTKTEIGIAKPEKIEPPKPEKMTRKPNRANPSSRIPKAGPRFAMDLGVAGGSGGASVPSDIISEQSGGGSFGSGDVDEKPSLGTSPKFQVPNVIREREIDAKLRLSFCVNVSGRAYDIRILEESPGGMGLAAAGRDALANAVFKPARKDGTAVPFCGLEQPFEIKFRG